MKTTYKNKTLVWHREYKYFQYATLSNPVDNLIPKLSSNTIPNTGQLIPSSELGAGYVAWKMFDRLSGRDTARWIGRAGMPNWCIFNFNEARIIDKYTFLCNTYVGAVPRSWEIQGSDDGSTWTTLHKNPDFRHGMELLKLLYLITIQLITNIVCM